MANLTKNTQTQDTLEKLVKHAFLNKEFKSIYELTEVFFNIAYLV